jgi:hypothetical protein
MTTTKSKTARPAKMQGSMASWLVFPFGIFYPSIRPAHTYDVAADPRSLQVRARRSQYLDALRVWCPELGPNVHNPAGRLMDYPWRCYIEPGHFAQAVGKLVMATDSEVMKPLTEGPAGLADPVLARELHNCLTAMWSEQLRLSDGTSSYDAPTWSGQGTPPDPKATELCRTQGHWFGVWRGGIGKARKRTCGDCGATEAGDGTVTYRAK